MKVKWFDVVETAVRTISKIGVKIFLPRWILKPSFHSLKNERCFSNANRHPHAMGTIFRNSGISFTQKLLKTYDPVPDKQNLWDRIEIPEAF